MREYGHGGQIFNLGIGEIRFSCHREISRTRGERKCGNLPAAAQLNSIRFSGVFDEHTFWTSRVQMFFWHLTFGSNLRKTGKKVTNARPNLTRFCSWGVVQQSWSSMFHVFVHRTFSSSHTCEKRVLLVIYHRQFLSDPGLSTGPIYGSSSL